MAFDDSTPTTAARLRYSGEGFRQEPDFREGTATLPAVAEPAPAHAAADAEPTMPVTKRGAPPNLTYVFDDPAEGEPGRDRMLVHGLWELLLTVAFACMAYLLYWAQSSTFTGDGLRVLALQATVVGLLASGGAVALRAGAVNLAVGPVAVAAALFFAQDSSGGLLKPLLTVVGLCAVLGAVQAMVMVGLHVPAWAASLAASIGLLLWTQQRGTASAPGVYSAGAHVQWWVGSFCAVSIILGTIGAIPSVRRAFGRFRPVSDPADRRGWLAALITIGAIIASTVLAGVAGVLSVSIGRSAAPSEGPLLSAVAIGVALVGGTSAFGRRGGIFGTVLAAGLFAVVAAYSTATNLNWSTAVLAGAALLIGLGVTRMVERFGRPLLDEEYEEDETGDWLLKTDSAAPAPASTSWRAGKPYEAATTQTSSGGLWAPDDAWGTAERG